MVVVKAKITEFLNYTIEISKTFITVKYINISELLIRLVSKCAWWREKEVYRKVLILDVEYSK